MVVTGRGHGMASSGSSNAIDTSSAGSCGRSMRYEDVGRVGQRLETMRAAGRDVERDLLVVTELEAFPVAVRRRHRPQVHDDVEDAAVGASHQLGLAGAAAHVQAAYHPADGAGEAVLREAGRVDPRLPRDLRVERAGEETALVHVRGGPEQQSPRYACDLADIHPTVPRPVPVGRAPSRGNASVPGFPAGACGQVPGGSLDIHVSRGPARCSYDRPVIRVGRGALCPQRA